MSKTATIFLHLRITSVFYVCVHISSPEVSSLVIVFPFDARVGENNIYIYIYPGYYQAREDPMDATDPIESDHDIENPQQLVN